ncbi:hypothetical protein SAMD00019534_125690 [Acytostelium subglobosum LB1]|uniref:hypothetical protein n=1 Tax=Acytostelium subglobosum LB1 TaxID=1410327 RepID=UPI000644AC47|nr:hypothetical protein SAMD00019534_125690 [Acytostelium subglobosum LB1]GAM29393.1 hypothetical protein SAMD00019534_125690 [Acytostelium subglobosum LB1]|eukprot:XP_012747661.1 hypothetical protein SAMD00019534_125690 [Acytostelium subglobosum LB1]
MLKEFYSEMGSTGQPNKNPMRLSAMFCELQRWFITIGMHKLGSLLIPAKIDFTDVVVFDMSVMYSLAYIFANLRLGHITFEESMQLQDFCRNIARHITLLPSTDRVIRVEIIRLVPPINQCMEMIALRGRLNEATTITTEYLEALDIALASLDEVHQSLYTQHMIDCETSHFYDSGDALRYIMLKLGNGHSLVENQRQNQSQQPSRPLRIDSMFDLTSQFRYFLHATGIDASNSSPESSIDSSYSSGIDSSTDSTTNYNSEDILDVGLITIRLGHEQMAIEDDTHVDSPGFVEFLTDIDYPNQMSHPSFDFLYDDE